jgi:hypothetical protein
LQFADTCAAVRQHVMQASQAVRLSFAQLCTQVSAQHAITQPGSNTSSWMLPAGGNNSAVYI